MLGISHAATIPGFKRLRTIVLIVIRTLAYLIVVYALSMHLKNSLMAKETRKAWSDFFQKGTQSPLKRHWLAGARGKNTFPFFYG